MADPLKYTSWDGIIRRELHVDPDNPYTFTQKTEVTLPDAFFERNKALGEDQKASKSSMKLVARAPMMVYEQAEREGWTDKDWAKWLNDPDNAAFRCWPGRV
jgi:hypothetical protein